MNSHFDALFCDERNFDEDWCDGLLSKPPQIREFVEVVEKGPVLSGHDLLWEDEEVLFLLCKEEKEGFFNYDTSNINGRLTMARNEAISWMLKTIEHYGFKAVTGVLAVNYFDRFITSHCFQTEKPWMGQLAAVACLSIAAKVEETQVPLLLDVQVEESKFIFEAKTVQRMELLVLSTLKWKMNPVTAMSYLDHIVRRFELLPNHDLEFLKRCETVLLSIFTDCRIAHCLPSTVAAAIVIYVLRETDSCVYEDQIMDVLRTNKEKIQNCHKLIAELMDDHARNKYYHKRKHETIPRSPSGVIDAYFSSDSSNESWSVSPSVSSSPEPLPKRTCRGA